MTYLRFLAAHRALLAFGFLLAFFSSYGQTFFISLFSAELRGLFDLTHGEFGAVYSGATLASAAVMIFSGQLIDRIQLNRFSLAVTLGLAAACFLMASLSGGMLLGLALSIFLLRFFGQGMMSHVSATAMARHFDSGRGRALAVASLGHAGGEALFPALTVLLVGWLSWRTVWGAYGLSLLVLLIPLIILLLRQQVAEQERRTNSLESLPAQDRERQWSRGEVLRDPLFYFLLPALMSPAFVNTGIFFNQVHLVESKGWPLMQFAVGFSIYAVSTVLSALICGALVDSVTAKRLFPLTLLPLASGLLVLALSDRPESIFVYMALAGISTAAFNTASGALWVEIYGYRHLGAIRSLAISIMVFSTALSPGLMGLLLDLGVSIENIILACSLLVAAAAASALAVYRRKP